MNISDTPTNSEATPQRSMKRRAAVGTVAGVLGGGAIGLMMMAPSLTSATDSKPAASPAAVIAQQDDTTGDDTTGDDTTGDDTTVDGVERGERLRDALEPLVTDGTITSDQADAVAAHLIANRPERSGHGPRGGEMGGGMGRGGRLGHSGVLAEVLGIDADQLREELRSGSSIAEIAAANGVEVQTVIDALVAEAETRLDQAVSDGKLTAEEAAEKLAEMTERVTARLNGEAPTGG